ncbi:MAG TPA: hypothetical protein VNZ53_10775 [Steroidobacteraceae bacterium]|jgi:hypothetical protein|nr:hypothetical protein [Steroidobacteraceae bacterium]
MINLKDARQVIAAAEAKAHELVRDRCQRELELSNRSSRLSSSIILANRALMS